MLGDLKKKSLLQLLCAVHSLENESELQDLRSFWLAENRKIHPGKIMQPVLARWKYAGESLVKFLTNVETHMTFAIKVKDTHATVSSKCDISSDVLSLVNEKVLVTMTYFLHEFYIKHWFTHFIIVQQHEPLHGMPA